MHSDILVIVVTSLVTLICGLDLMYFPQPYHSYSQAVIILVFIYNKTKSSFNALIHYTTPTFITEMLCLPTNLLSKTTLTLKLMSCNIVKCLIMITRPQNIETNEVLRPGHHYQKFEFYQKQETLATPFDFTSYSAWLF